MKEINILKKDKYLITKKTSLLLVSIIISFIPIIVRLGFPMHKDATHVWGSFINIDFYSYYKMLFFIGAGLLLFIMFLLYLNKNKIKASRYYIFLAVYGIMVAASAIFSEYGEIVFKGFPDRYENSFVLLGYILLVVVVINIIDDKKSVKLVLGGVLISATVLSIHGLLQYYNYDLFATDFGRRLITPAGKEFFVDRLSFIGRRVIYSTMYNPNFVGSYATMVVMAGIGLFLTTRDRVKVRISGVLAVLFFAFLIGSRSRAGYMGFIAGSFLLIIFMRRLLLKRWKRVLYLLIAFSLVFIVMDARPIDEIFQDIVSPMSEEELLEEELIIPPVVDIRGDGNILELETRATEIIVEYTGDSFMIMDSEGQRIGYRNNRDSDFLELTEEGFENHRFHLKPFESELIWNYDGKDARFVFEDGEFLMAGMHGNLYEIEPAASFGFEGYERLGSSRGYIWSRSIPLLRETLILGKGPDTFAMYFPQDDVIGKLRFLRSPDMIVDKPHNLYLQIGINTGVISLIALLGLWLTYLIDSLRLYWSSEFRNWSDRVGLAMILAVGAYLIAGIFNDSVISVTPVFWIFLGIGLSMNIINRDNL